MAGNSNFNTLLTTTIDNRTRKLADNLSKNNAVLHALEKFGGIKPFDGGNKIVQETMYTAPGNSGSYGEGDTLPTNTGEFASASEYGIKMYATSINISGLKQAQNSGKAKMIDYIVAATDNAQTDLINSMVKGLYSDGSGNSGKDLTGIQAMVSTTPALGTYGNISAVTDSWWRNQALTGTVIDSSNVYDKFFAMYLSLCRGTESPDIAVACTSHFTALNKALFAMQRFNEESTSLAKAGFKNVQFMNTSVVFENDSSTGMPSDKTYFLNTKYMFLRPYQSMDFQAFGQDPYAIDATVKSWKWYGNLTCSRRAAHGVVSNT